MKKILCVLLSGLALWACTREEVIDNLDSPRVEMVFHASTGSPEATKTSRMEDGSVFWNQGEKISVFYGKDNSGVFVSQNTEQSASADFKGTLGEFEDNGEDFFWGVYPFRDDNSFDGKSVGMTLPKTQTAVEGTFENELFLSLARTKDNTLHFKNLCGGIKISLLTSNVKSITIKGNNGETIAGKVKAGWSEDGVPVVESILSPETEITLTAPGGGFFEPGKYYYFVMLPVKMENGYTMTFNREGDSSERVVEAAVNIKRSRFGVVENADAVFNVAPNEILYVSTDGEIVSPNMSGIVSNTYENGIGRIVFERALTTLGSSRPFMEKDNLKMIFLPEGLTSIKYYSFYSCKNLEYISLPSTLETIDNYAFCYSGLKSVDIPGGVKTIESSLFSACDKLKVARINEGTTTIDGWGFYNCTSLESILLPSTLESIGYAAFYRCRLKSVELGENVRTISDFAFYDCPELESVTFHSDTPPQIEKYSFYGDFKIFVPEEAARDYMSALPECFAHIRQIGWNADYQSTDYSANGRWTLISKATEGNGIDLVLMGDCFTDENIRIGFYDTAMEHAIEAFFAEEPYKSFRNLFNVYKVDLVSPWDGFQAGRESALGTYLWDDGDHLEVNSQNALDYVRTFLDEDRIDDVIVVVVDNTTTYWGGTCCWSWSDKGAGSGYSVSSCPFTPYSLEWFYNTVQHEAGGHGFVKFGDEYFYGDGEFPEESKQIYQRDMDEYEWYMNLDFESDPAKVKWADMIASGRYETEGLGVYEGGLVDYSKGVFRATETSIMSSDISGFNAPSRRAIYKRIHLVAYGYSWEYDEEEFNKYDERNIGQKKDGSSARRMQERSLQERPHLGKDTRIIYPESKRNNL